MMCNGGPRVLDFSYLIFPPSIKDKVHRPNTSVWPYLIHWAQFLDLVCFINTMKMGHSFIYLGLAILTIFGKYYVYWCKDNTFSSFIMIQHSLWIIVPSYKSTLQHCQKKSMVFNVMSAPMLYLDFKIGVQTKMS